MEPTADKMMDAPSQTVYLVRCTGTKDGHQCTAYVGLSPIDKTVCPACGQLLPPWGTYLTTRTKDV